MNTTEFIEKAKQVHSNKYDYSETVYTGHRDKLTIICPMHGAFLQRYDQHLIGKGCPPCGKEKLKISEAARRMTTEQFIEKAKVTHGDKYDYSKTQYYNARTKVIITCPEHGDWETNPASHIFSNGCPKCADGRQSERRTLSTDTFIENAKKVHGNIYDYSKVLYQHHKIPVEIICSKHGPFLQRPFGHTTLKNGCPKCSDGYSQAEQNLSDWITSLGLENRPIRIGRKQIDIFIPSRNIGIEYNGLYWHSEDRGKGEEYHLDKTKLANDQGIRLIHIFEDEWIEKQDLVKRKLLHIFGLTQDKIYARQTEIKKVPAEEHKSFLEENHIQGYVPCSIVLGLYYNQKLVTLASFAKNRFEDLTNYELVRYASSTLVVGGLGKILSHLRKNYSYIKELISFCDLRWSEGNVYRQTGFTFVANTKPSYFWVKNGVRYNRQKFMKHKLSKVLEIFDPNLTEEENCKANGYTKVYDCGHQKWVLNLSPPGYSL